MKTRGVLYALARLMGDWSAVSSGKPKKVLRRGKNRLVGRAIGKAGGWRRLWK